MKIKRQTAKKIMQKLEHKIVISWDSKKNILCYDLGRYPIKANEIVRVLTGVINKVLENL